MLNGSKEEVSKTVKCKKNKLRFLVRRMQDSVNNAKNHSCSYVESRLQKNQQQKPKLMSNHKQITGHKADMQGNCPYTQAMTGF